jgi:large subunit ribosomal protein L30
VAAKPAGGDRALRVTWTHSTIGHNAAARGTIRALGLHRLHETVAIADTPGNRGMIRRVAFLLNVQEPQPPESGATDRPAPGREASEGDEEGGSQP